MTTRPGGVPIAGFLSTTDDVDTYPTHLDELGKGGIHPAQDIAARDAIPADRRSEGMLCYVLDDFALYQLSDGIENTDWVLIFSIVDGEVVLNQTLPENYIFHGGENNIILKSPVLLDARLDILRIKAAEFILARPNEQLNSAQVLSELQSGYMYNNNGTVEIRSSIPAQELFLTKGKLLLGDDNNKASEVQRITFDNMANFLNSDPLKLLGVYNLVTGSANPLTLGDPTPTLAIQRCNLANLTVGHIWFGAKVPPDVDPLNFGFNRPTEINKLPTDFLELPFNKILIGNVFDRASAQDRLEPENLAPLTFNNIWRGNAQGFPEESTALTDAENAINTIQNVTIPGIEAEIAGIQAEIVVIEGEIAAIQAQLVVVEGAIAALQAQVLVLQSQVSALNARVTNIENNEIPNLQSQIDSLNTRLTTAEGQITNIQATLVSLQDQIDDLNTDIANLRLNNIPADADVSFSNFKLIDLADPVNDTDGVNLQTLKEYRPYINIYNDNNLAVTSVTANVFTKGLGQTFVSASRLFTMTADNTIRYDGVIPLDMSITLALTMRNTGSFTRRLKSVAVYKNGVIVPGSLSSDNARGSDETNLTSICITNLTTNDIIEYYIRSDNSETLIVNSVSLTITAT